MADVTNGLRELADFLDAHPEIELTTPSHMVYVSSRDALVKIARLGNWAKSYRGDYFKLNKQFSGDVSLEVFTDRSEVCRRVVTGKRLVPAVEAHEEDVVEWMCDEPLLREGV